jgi:hypothetical protein
MAFDTGSSHARERVWFSSKRDAWLIAVVWAAQATILWAMAMTAMDPDASLAFKFVMVLALAGTFGFTIWVVYGTRYGFSRDRLVIRSGPFKWRVPLSDIDSVRPSRNPLSSPATSLDRLHVRYGKRSVLISPEDKPGFLRALVARAPELEIVGDAAERRDGEGP